MIYLANKISDVNLSTEVYDMIRFVLKSATEQ